jgi:hypothetical protein
VLNALYHKKDLGWATITHPFHPLKSKTFKILFLRKVNNKVILSLRKSGHGSFSVLQEWTNKSQEQNHLPQIFSLTAVLELTSLISQIKKKGVDK